MFENTAQSRTRDAIRAAHAERGQVLAEMVGKLFRKSPR